MIRRILQHRIARLVVVAIVPAVVLGVFIGALAAADAGRASVPAALVDEDRLVQTKAADGSTTTIAAGRLVVSGLTKPSSGSGIRIDWTLTNAADAAKLLKQGSVYAVVTIPSDFSKSIATVSKADPQQADIRVTTDDAHGTLVSQIGGLVGSTIASSVGGQITSNVVSGLYGGYATLHTSLTKAADGADQLGDGASALSTGLAKAADGGETIADGTRSLGSGARRLASGAGSLGDGLRTAADGAASAASGAGRLSSGIDRYTDGVSSYTSGVNRFLSGIAPAFSAKSAAAQGQLASGTGSIASALQGVAAQDPTLSAQTKGALTALAGRLDQIAAGQRQLAAGAQQLSAAGAAIPRLESGGRALASGGSSLDSGAAALASGLGKLPAGIRSAATGADRLSSGATRLASGADSLATGTDRLASGVRKSAGGAGSLATGAKRLGSGLASGAEQLPNLTKAQQQRAGKVVASPITSSASRENELSGAGEIVSTLIVPVGLWIGAAALVLLFGPVARRLLVTGVGTGRLVGGALLRGAVVAVGQAVLVVVLLAAALGVGWPALPLVFVTAVVAGVAFLAIHQVLQTLFGRAGTVLSIVLLGVQLVAVGGLYPIQLVSAPFQVLSPLLPLTAAVDATTAALTGAGGFGAALLSLVLWAVLAFVIEVALVTRRRSSPAMFRAVPALP